MSIKTELKLKYATTNNFTISEKVKVNMLKNNRL